MAPVLLAPAKSLSNPGTLWCTYRSTELAVSQRTSSNAKQLFRKIPPAFRHLRQTETSKGITHVPTSSRNDCKTVERNCQPTVRKVRIVSANGSLPRFCFAALAVHSKKHSKVSLQKQMGAFRMHNIALSAPFYRSLRPSCSILGSNVEEGFFQLALTHLLKAHITFSDLLMQLLPGQSITRHLTNHPWVNSPPLRAL